MSLSNLIREHSRRTSPHLLYTLTFVRSMGGGPRTFPGGLNKWQWKRMHEKKAREKENKLLEQEKQLYQSRIRSQIRAKLVGESDSKPTKSDPNGSHNYAPMTPKDHIKALADRFMTEGAEDLWNEADGPIKSPSPTPPIRRNAPIGAPIDLRNLVSGRDGERTVNLGNLNGAEKARDYSVIVRSRIKSRFDFQRNESSIDLGILVSRARTLGDGERTTVNLVNLNGAEKFRHYSVVARRRPKSRFDFRRKENSTSDDDSELEDGSVRMSVGNAKWPRFGLISKDEKVEEDDDDEMEGKENVKKLMSSAALGKYDSIKRRRVPLKFLEEEVDVSGEVDLIRNELKKRNLNENLDQKSDDDTIISQKRFDECDISPLTVKALNGAGYMRMTRVQEATLSACLEGKDALVKAKTGTGKSAAFLLPAIESVLKASNSNTNQRVLPIYVLILCPTRELASQLAAEANVILKYYDGIGVQTLVGGTRFKLDQKRLESDPCQIIVATPGRLLDHIENKSGFSARLMGLKMLILDEADHLLDLGFRKDVEKIVDCVPRQRQSLLFSATLPKEVRRISQLVLKREHVYIDTVGLGCLATHSKVKQSYLVAPHELNFQIVHHLLKEHISEVVDYKVLVFCTTAMVTSLMFLLLREMKMNVREIHSRKPQLYRTRISDEFRESKRLILITSDVSARGMNYPDVTLVIQVGIPSDREQYIHRLGRTGREGKAGEGILLLAPWEEYFLDEINDLPLEKYLLPHVNPFIKVQMEDSMKKIDSSIKEAAYHAWLGYYNSIREIGRDKTTLVELANQFSESIGLQKPPSLFRKTAIKMGLKDIPGIRVRK